LAISPYAAGPRKQIGSARLLLPSATAIETESRQACSPRQPKSAAPSAWRRASELAREGGLRAIWFTALRELCYRRVEIREYVLDNAADNDLDDARLSIEQLNAADIEQYNAFRKPSDPESAQRRMLAGHQCFIARHKDKIVCASWGATKNATSRYLSAPIALTPDEVYAYDLFTAPEWRQQGIAAAVTRALHNFYRAEGKRRVLRLIVPENHAAITGTLGYQSIGTMGFLGAGRFRVNFCHMHAGKIAPGKLQP
jgi:GNAT superfamily N-acetyltransferase